MKFLKIIGSDAIINVTPHMTRPDKYIGKASAEGYTVDGVALNLSDKDQKCLGIKDTFKF